MQDDHCSVQDAHVHLCDVYMCLLCVCYNGSSGQGNPQFSLGDSGKVVQRWLGLGSWQHDHANHISLLLSLSLYGKSYACVIFSY